MCFYSINTIYFVFIRVHGEIELYEEVHLQISEKTEEAVMRSFQPNRLGVEAFR